MLCAELERLEAELEHIIAALENPALTEQERGLLEDAHLRVIHAINNHETLGHNGRPCFEEQSSV